MNVVHKVAVLFHAHDRMSGRLQHMQGRFASLTKAQGDYARSLSSMEKLEAKAADAVRRSDKAQAMATVNRMQMRKQEASLARRLGDEQSKHDARRQALAEQYSDRQAAQLNNQRNITRQHATQTQAIQDRFHASTEASRRAHGARIEAIDRQINKARLRVGALEGQQRPEINGFATNTAQLRQYKTALERARSEAIASAVAQSTGNRQSSILAGPNGRMLVSNEKLAQDELSRAQRAADAAARPFNKQISSVNSAVSMHEKQDKVVEDLHQSQRALRDLSDTRARMDADHIAAINRISAAETEAQRKHATQASELIRKRWEADSKALGGISAQGKANDEAHRRTMAGLEAERTATNDIHALRRRALDEANGLNQARVHGLENEYNAELRNAAAMEKRMHAIEHHQNNLRKGLMLGMGAGMLGLGLVSATRHVAEVGMEYTAADQRLQGMGVQGALFNRVSAINRAQSGLNRGVDYRQATDTFAMLHAVLGGPEAVLGKNLNDTSTLTLVNKFKAGVRNRYAGISDAAMDSGIRAAELGSSSNKADGTVRTHAERTANFKSRMELVHRGLGATGGTLRMSDILAGMKTMQANKFNLSDDGFLKMMFVMQELGGGRTGTAMNGLMTNMLMGQQVGYKNLNMGKMGLLNMKDKSIVRDKNGGIKSFNPMTAFVGAHQLMSDPAQWVHDVFKPKMQSALKKQGKSFTPENAQLALTQGIMGTVGRQNAQGLVSILFQQSQRIQDDFFRAKTYAEGISKAFDKAQGTYKFVSEQTAIEWKNLNNEMAKGILPVAASFLRTMNPTIRALADAAGRNPQTVGAVFTALGALAVTGGLYSVVLVFSALRGLAAVNLGAAAVGLNGAAGGLGAVGAAAALPGLALLGEIAVGLGLVAGAAVLLKRISDPTAPPLLPATKPRFGPGTTDTGRAHDGNRTGRAFFNPAGSGTQFVNHEGVVFKTGHARPYGPSPYVSPLSRKGGHKASPNMEGAAQATMTWHVILESKGDTPVSQRNSDKVAATLHKQLHAASPHVGPNTHSAAHRVLPPNVTRR